jgi:hypothetical protein
LIQKLDGIETFMSDSIISQWDRILEVLIEIYRETFIDSLDKRIVESTIGFFTRFKSTIIEPTVYARK